MFSYTCAKTHMPIRAMEMGDEVGVDDHDSYADLRQDHAEHPRKLLQIRYWEKGVLKTLTGKLAGEDLWLLEGRDEDGNHLPPMDLRSSNIHDRIVAGTAFVLAVNFSGHVPDDFRGISYDDPGQGDLMIDDELCRFLDERRSLPSHDVLEMLSAGALSVEHARNLDDAMLLRLGTLDREIRDGVRAKLDPSHGGCPNLLWRVSQSGTILLELKNNPDFGIVRVRSEADISSAIREIASIATLRADMDRLKREYAVPTLNDIAVTKIQNRVRALDGLDPLWVLDVDPEVVAGIKARS